MTAVHKAYIAIAAVFQKLEVLWSKRCQRPRRPDSCSSVCTTWLLTQSTWVLLLLLQAFTDHAGCVVLCFDRAAAAAEGDLTSYLNHQEKHGIIMLEFK